jgi:hypothetical protein
LPLASFAATFNAGFDDANDELTDTTAVRHATTATATHVKRFIDVLRSNDPRLFGKDLNKMDCIALHNRSQGPL